MNSAFHPSGVGKSSLAVVVAQCLMLPDWLACTAVTTKYHSQVKWHQLQSEIIGKAIYESMKEKFLLVYHNAKTIRCTLDI